MEEVAVSAFRANLSDWIQRAKDGEEVVITERGIPVARMVGTDRLTLMEDLIERGVVAPPLNAGPKQKAGRATRVRGKGNISDLVSELRR